MNIRRVLSWIHHRLVVSAEAGRLRVRVEGRLVAAVDDDDVDAWLAGEVPPSLVRARADAPQEYAAAGVEIG